MKHEHALRAIGIRVKGLESNTKAPAPLPYEGYKAEAEATKQSLQESARVLYKDAGVTVEEACAVESGKDESEQ
ncbi:MAG: hypothetical protein HQ559_13580 [Lentisphaerae bacterium]|nr:hypothetical protein [Lentisphaerota bacterium]